MTWLAYLVGALAGRERRRPQPPPFWLGLACLFLIEVATVSSNECSIRERPPNNRNTGRSPAARACW